MSDFGRAGGNSGDLAAALEPRSAARIRVLPDGSFLGTAVLCRELGFLEIELSGSEIVSGQPLEIESGTALYWGDLESRRESIGRVRIEHYLDRAKFSKRQDWG